MELDEIVRVLDEFVRGQFELDGDPDYGTDVNLFDYGYVDSLGAAEIIMFIEERFNCTISQKDISKYPMNTVEEIAKVVSDKLS
ncbi:MAG: acyl carrier protein [Oscillospiraceae bacterium]|jgi:methoxymalonate biosynthesis acyl carrier protein